MKRNLAFLMVFLMLFSLMTPAFADKVNGDAVVATLLTSDSSASVHAMADGSWSVDVGVFITKQGGAPSDAGDGDVRTKVDGTIKGSSGVTLSKTDWSIGDYNTEDKVTASGIAVSTKDYTVTFSANSGEKGISQSSDTITIHVIVAADTTAPVITIAPYTTTPTNHDVIVNASTSEGTLNAQSHTFTANGSFDFVATDGAGNKSTKTVTISNIDKTPPVITLGSYITSPTNQSILVSASTNEGALNSANNMFLQNGNFDFVATDLAGNVTTKTVTITNIDKTAPIITVDQYITSPTNQDITVNVKTNEGSLNALSHIFSANGSFDFVATDLAGNVSTKNITITNIDKTAPIILIGEYTKTATNQDIIVTASANEGNLNTGSHTFTGNGSFDFVAIDAAGNKTIQTVNITNIDKLAPVITIADYKKTPTNADIEVVASTNKGSLNAISHVFTENGSFDFVASDVSGNVTKQTVTITNIDKTAPIITIGDYIKTPTNKDIIVSASTNEGKLNETSHTFVVNGSFEFIATDDAGNVTTRKVSIVNIDKVAPVITVDEYTKLPTNKDINVTASTDKGSLNETSHIFTENGNFDFIAKDEAGNVSTLTVIITNIDKIGPDIIIGEYTTTETNQDIVVTASVNEGKLNETSHKFTANGSYDFVATDDLGNVATKTISISNIDKTAPVITIEEYTKTPTNQDVVVNANTNEGKLNETSHIFDTNGSFEFVATDDAGNVTSQKVIITNIDKVAPVITIDEYSKILTNQDIKVTASTNKGKLNETSHTFSENGRFDFVATDEAGNVTTQNVCITNIDKIAAVITIDDYITSPTNQDIIVNASTNKGNLNEASHTFTVNGSFDFVAKDEAGNVTIQKVSITNIDKTAPIITIDKYTTALTNKDIEVTASTNEGNLNETRHIFTENGSFDFIATDEAGNVTTQNVTIKNIDKLAPVITIEEYITTTTNQSITVKASTNKGKLNEASHTFSENGSFDFVATDESGNVTTQVVIITNIDKTAPIITIGEYIKTATNKDIVVTASTNEGLLNETSHSFTTNGSFDFVARDEAGNVTTQKVTITNIDRIAPVVTIGQYTRRATNRDINVVATTNEGTLNETSHIFTENGSFDFVATDEAGNVTSQNVTITNIDKTAPVISLSDYTKTITNQYIRVTAKTNEGRLNDASHTFKSNGSFTFTATDMAGNVTKILVTITNIDRVAPKVSMSSPSDEAVYILKQSVLADWSAADASGIALAVGTVTTGTAIDTSSVGRKTFTVSAIDKAGNKTTRTISYTVKYAFSGVLQPIDPNGKSIFKTGSVVPVKFQLKDSNGSLVSGAKANFASARISSSILGTKMETVLAGVATSGSSFKYDTASNQYVFNMATKDLRVGTYQLTIRLDDGKSYTVNVSIK